MIENVREYVRKFDAIHSTLKLSKIFQRHQKLNRTQAATSLPTHIDFSVVKMWIRYSK